MKRGNPHFESLPNSKHAQVTIFIIIALVIVGAVAGYYVIQNIQEVPFESLSFNEQTDVIETSIIDCFNEIYEESLDYVGLQGGYSREPLSEYLDTGFYNIPFYYYDTITYVPFTEFIEEELAYAVEFKSLDCINSISNYNIESDFNYKSTNVSIGDGSVTFLTDLDLTLSRGEDSSKINFKKHPFEIKSNIKEMNDFGSYIAFSHEINEGSLCISCFTEIAHDRGLTVEITNDMENVLMVNIIDNRTNYYPQVYTFFMTDVPSDDEGFLIPGLTEPITEEVLEETEITQEEYDQALELELNLIAPVPQDE